MVGDHTWFSVIISLYQPVVEEVLELVHPDLDNADVVPDLLPLDLK